MFLIDEKGEKIGEIDTSEALRRAEDAGLDLVEVNPNDRPPVCKILDYGKHKYRQKKRQASQKSHQAKVKEVRVKPRTDEHDLQVRLKQARKFINNGDKVLVSCRFRGRELAHKDYGFRQMERFMDELRMITKVEKQPAMEGRARMTMLLAPLTKEQRLKLEKQAEEEAKAAASDSQRKRRVIAYGNTEESAAAPAEEAAPADNDEKTGDDE